MRAEKTVGSPQFGVALPALFVGYFEDANVLVAGTRGVDVA